jgi:hypothetical protein
MLIFQHFIIDTGIPKCCFSSTMKRQTFFILTGILAFFTLFSCTPNFAPSAEGRRSGDSAVGRNTIDSILATPAERPGLATGWGNEKDSPIYGTSFVRSSSKPAGTDVIYYNDPQGIAAMSNSTVKVEPLQSAAGSLVEWGIKGGVGFLPTYKSGGWYGDRLVAGRKSSNYSIVIRNRSKSTLEVVASVDGLDVMDGKSASFSKRGYLIDPGKTLEIDGFRTSEQKVAAFEFSSVGNSYANLRHGDTRNVGVIGLAVFTQKGVDPWNWSTPETRTRLSAQPFAQAP